MKLKILKLCKKLIGELLKALSHVKLKNFNGMFQSVHDACGG